MREPAAITYRVESLEPTTHRAHFAIDIRGLTGGSLELVLPLWAPGAYEIRESAREVRELSACRSSDGQRLEVERVEKNRWRVTTQGAPDVEVRYTVYGHELTDDGMDVTDEHLYLNATRCFPWVAGRESEPVEVELHLPPTWKAYAELPRVSESPARFRARDYEELVDTPFDCGTPRVIELRPGGILHRIVICGGPGNYEPHRLEEDVGRIVSAQIALFGGSPLSSYTFHLHLHDRRDGGLEHRASTSLVVERNSFRPPEAYDRILTLFSHEYLHLYNVKRIRPSVLGPFDFTREAYTRQLWWMEGTTDYASLLALRRAELFTPQKFLAKLADEARNYLLVPGRAVVSLEQASFCAWIDLYRGYEETRNQSVSYYLKGLLVSAGLDLEIRHRTDNRASLEEVLRRLWKEYGLPGRGLAEGELFEVISATAAVDLTDFFDPYIRGTAEFDLDRFARHAGLRLGPAPRPTGPEEESEGAYLGLESTNDGGRVRVRSVLDHTPARRAGISPGDEIIALDGARVLYDGFTEGLKRYGPGESVVVDLFRRGILRRLTVELAAPPPKKFQFTPDPEAAESAKRTCAAWLGAPWESLTPAGSKQTG